MKIRVLPHQPHCFAFGGFEIQMLDALKAAKEAGADVQPLDVWSRDSDFDILHVWGFEASHLPAIYWAHRSGKRVVMTALLGYFDSFSLANRLRKFGSRVLGRSRALREISSYLDLLVVLNEAQADVATNYYDIPRSKITIIPNIINEDYFNLNGDILSRTVEHKVNNYILCTGNICKRKNQLALTEAALSARTSLLLVGPVLAGEEEYGNALTKLIAGQESVRWIAGLPQGSHELLAAYRGCIGFALPSYIETQPISALEAAAAGKPLLLADLPWARQSFYQGAYLSDPDSPSAIKHGIECLRQSPTSFIPPKVILERCRSTEVGAAYAQAYARAAQA